MEIAKGFTGARNSVVDQVLVALTAVCVTFGVARLATAREFGSFALMQVILMLGVGAFPATAGTWAMTVAPGSRTAATRNGLVGLAIACGAVVDVGLVPALFLIDSEGNRALIGCFILAIPCVLTVEAIRWGSHAGGLHNEAALVSAAVFLVFCVSTVIIQVWQWPWWCAVLCYGLTYFIVGVVAMWLLRLHPSGADARALFSSGRASASSLLWNYALAFGLQAAVPYLLTVAGGLRVAAGLRGAQSLVGLPLQVPQGLVPYFMKQTAAKYANDGRMDSTGLTRWTLLQCAIILPCVAASLIVPDRLGSALLGSTWPWAKPALPIILLASLASQILLGIEVRLRVIGRIELLSVARLVMLIPTIGMVVIGAHMQGVLGAAIGMATADFLMLILVRARVARALSAPEEGATEGETAGPMQLGR